VQVVREHLDGLVSRVRVLNALVVAVLVAIGAGFWVVQLVRGEYYRALAENNRLRKLSIKAPRGLIYDRHGRLLVDNVPSYNLTIDRSRAADLDASVHHAAQVLGRDERGLAALLAGYAAVPDFKPVLLAENLSLSQVARIGVAALEYPELEIEVEHVRLYRHREQTAHLLGYLGEVTDEEIVAAGGRYALGDLVGKKGVEKTYDALLRGRDGERVVVVDSRGRLLEEYGSKAAVPGTNLTLTIDLDLQQVAARLLEGPEKVGAIVALDPRNGEILALVSSPSYNPNLFARRLERAEWKALREAPYDPLQNRAMQNTFSPGSTFKMVMATAGLSEGVVDEHTTAYCSGAKAFYGRTFRCWRAGGHGTVDARAALRQSCDVYFYQLGQRLGIERIARYARMFGLGAPTHVDIQGEKLGLVPDSAWSLAVRKHPWYPGETISVAIGQGPILVTPLQMAVMTAVVANGGRHVTPHLFRDAKLARPRHEPLDPHALEVVREGLWQVVNAPGGSAFAHARIDGADIAGKTGSVQVIGQKVRTDAFSLPFKYRDHAWFTAFAPAGAPRLVVTVFAEHGGAGSRSAAPVARALYARFFAADHQSPDAR
jgi:penicillin-binding protein 2